jgi:hypothetical protein
MPFAIVVLFMSVFTQVLYAANANQAQKEMDRKVETLIGSIVSINNVEVLLKNHRSQLTPTGYEQLLDIAKKSPDQRKLYYAKKMSKRSFALKLKNSTWAQFTFQNDGSLMIGKTPFLWDSKNDLRTNMNKISQIMTKEYGSQKQSAFQFLIEDAHADWEIHTTFEEIVVVLASSASKRWGTEKFLSVLDDLCSGDPSWAKNVARPDKKATKSEIQDQFKSAKKEVDSYGSAWSFLTTNFAWEYERFDRVQRCLEKTGFIEKDAFLQKAVEAGEKARANEVSP